MYKYIWFLDLHSFFPPTLTHKTGGQSKKNIGLGIRTFVQDGRRIEHLYRMA